MAIHVEAFVHLGMKSVTGLISYVYNPIQIFVLHVAVYTQDAIHDILSKLLSKIQ